MLLHAIKKTAVPGCLLCLTLSSGAETLVDQLIERYERINTVTCDVRRDITNDDGRMRWLSRVHFKRPDRLHVENHAPLPRRIIADGQRMYQHNEGHPRGFRKAIAELPGPMLDGLRKVPGTVMDHLFRIQKEEEMVLDSEGGAYPIRRGYEADNLYVVLESDEEWRLGRMSFYESADRTTLTAAFEFEAFVEVLDGVWIPMVHRGRFYVGGLENEETTRISNYAVNTPVPDHLFDADLYFPDDIEWVDQFDEL